MGSNIVLEVLKYISEQISSQEIQNKYLIKFNIYSLRKNTDTLGKEENFPYLIKSSTKMLQQIPNRKVKYEKNAPQDQEEDKSA